ncbi:MAG: PPC domain-containing DNA-binding protein [Kofleriaceae bacterium]
MEIPTVRWVSPGQAKPRGQAPGAKTQLLSAQPDGVKSYVLVLRTGDEVATALAEFARRERVVNAHFVAIGAVRDPEVAWFDMARKQYKGITRHEQMEVLTLSGDIALGEDGAPVVHAHTVLGASDGSAWGGHVLGAIASPTLEVYVTCFPQPLHKRFDQETGLQLIDPSGTWQAR